MAGYAFEIYKSKFKSRLMGLLTVSYTHLDVYKRQTDKYGRFFLTNVESSTTSEVKVSKSGFKSVITAVDVLPSETTTIELSLEASSGIIPIVIGGIVLVLAILGTIFVQLKKKK